MEALRQQMIGLLFIVLGMIITPLIFIALDYWAGIRKARKRGDRILSNKMKRTVEKISKYYNCIFAMMVLDSIQIAGFLFLHLYNGWQPWTFPLFTMAGVLFVAFIEIKSIYEPADVKEQRDMQEVAMLAKAIASHRNEPEEIAAAVMRYLSHQQPTTKPKRPRRNGTDTKTHRP